MPTSSSFAEATSPVRPVSAPAWPMRAAVGAAVVAGLLLFPARNSLVLAVTGYALGALATPAMTVLFRFGRQAAAKNPFYVVRPAVERWLTAALLVGIVAGLAHAWLMATELAKL